MFAYRAKFFWEIFEGANLPNVESIYFLMSVPMLWSVIFPVGNSDHDTYVDDAATLKFAVLKKLDGKLTGQLWKIIMGGMA